MKIYRKEKVIDLWGDRPYPPFLMRLCLRSTVIGLKKIFPQSSINYGGNYWENRRGNYFFSEKKLLDTVNKLSTRALKNPEFIYNLFKIALQRAKNFKKFSEKYKNTNLSKIPFNELLDFLNIMCKKYYDFYSYATIAPLLGYSQDGLIYSEINKIIRRKFKNNLIESSDIIRKMTDPPRKLKNHDLEIAILRLAERVQKIGLKNKREIINKFKKELQGIKNQFEFMSFDFCDSVSWDLDYFAELVLEKTKVDIQKRIREIKNYNFTKKKEFQYLCQKLSLSVNEKKPFEIIRNLGLTKWTREYEFQEAIYNLKFIIDELGRRCHFSTLESKYLFPEEYKIAMTYPGEYKLIIKNRFKNLLILLLKSEELILVGKKAKQEYKKFIFQKSLNKINNKKIKGMVAYGGRVTGYVKIINKTKDLKKMKMGNILISIATSAELFTAMKMAAAIVTNEGGITSHAAIVAREFKIPCIVGTRTAANVFKDGDLVEVDANRGIIKKIK